MIRKKTAAIIIIIEHRRQPAQSSHAIPILRSSSSQVITMKELGEWNQTREQTEDPDGMNVPNPIENQ